MRSASTTLALVAVAALAVAAQQAAAAGKNPAGQFVIKVSRTVVVETVSVTDKNGNVIEGLTAKDFTITEDNVPQAITYCEYQKLSGSDTRLDANLGAPTPVAVTPAAAAPAVAAVGETSITPETPGDNRYKDRRLIVLYFDMSAMPVPDQLRALDSAQKFLKSNMTAADKVAVLTYAGNGVKVKLDFTDNRDQINSTIENLVVGDELGMDESTSDAATADYGSAFGQDDSEFNIFTTNRQLAALQTSVNMLAQVSEKKAFVYFSSGLNLNGVDNQAQLQATVNAAVRAGVMFFPVDARGLVASAPLGDATQGSPGGMSMYNGTASMQFSNRMLKSQDTLYSLAADTGGKAMFDNNDLGAGIVQAQKAITNYYILSYNTTNTALDGKYRRVKVAYNGDPNAKLAYRVGYYAGKVFGKFTEADKERQLEDALMLGDPITELTVDAQLNYFQLDSANYFVPISTKIPGSELALAKSGGAEKAEIDFIGEVKDEYGTTITNLRDFANMKLSDTTAAQLAKSPIEFNSGVTLLPGKYSVKLLVRDSETGRMGTYMTTFTIPNLNKVLDRLPISSVVLSSQQVALNAALYNAKKDTAKDAEQANNPLVNNGLELIPSVTDVFSQQGQMFVYLQAYERGQATMQPLLAYVTFYRGAHKAFETPPQPITSGLDPHSKAVPITFNFPLNKLQPGRYTCQVTVIDPTNQKANFWQTPVYLLP